MESEGLLMLMTPGWLSGHLEHPTSGYRREYHALVLTGSERSITPHMVMQLEAGLKLRDGDMFAPMSVELLGNPSDHRAKRWVRMSLSEGKNREVRRCWEHYGFHVERLVRVAYGPFELGTLVPGEVSEVPPGAVQELAWSYEQAGPLINRLQGRAEAGQEADHHQEWPLQAPQTPTLQPSGHSARASSPSRLRVSKDSATSSSYRGRRQASPRRRQASPRRFDFWNSR